MIISIGNGVRSSVNEETENMYGGKITIYTNSEVEGNDVKFTEEDFALVKEKVEHCKVATTQYSYWGPQVRHVRVTFQRILRVALRTWWE